MTVSRIGIRRYSELTLLRGKEKEFQKLVGASGNQLAEGVLLILMEHGESFSQDWLKKINSHFAKVGSHSGCQE